MGLFNAIGNGLSQAGYAAGDQFAKSALYDSQSELELMRQQRLAEFKEQMTIREEERKRAPLNRLQGMVREEAGRDVPLDAAPVTSLYGAGAVGIDPTKPADASFKGDARKLLKDIMALPDGQDKEQALTQFKSQYGAEMDANQAAVAGKTRKRTGDEALDAALERARGSDLEAYSAGKPLAADKTVTVADGASVIDPKTGRVVFSNANAKEAREAEREDRRDARAAHATTAAEERQARALAAAEARQAAGLSAQEDRADRRAEEGRIPPGYRRKSDGSLEPIPGGPATIGKALPTKLVNDLNEQAHITDSTERFRSTFNNEFAGHTITGDASNTSKRIFGDESGQAQWWQDYALHEATVRNKLFGASLTNSEQTEWQKLTVSPRMNAEQVRQNLERRADIEQRSLNRLMVSSAKAGYNKEQISALTGREMPSDDSTKAPLAGKAGAGKAPAGWSIREVK